METTVVIVTSIYLLGCTCVPVEVIVATSMFRLSPRIKDGEFYEALFINMLFSWISVVAIFVVILKLLIGYGSGGNKEKEK